MFRESLTCVPDAEQRAITSDTRVACRRLETTSSSRVKSAERRSDDELMTAVYEKLRRLAGRLLSAERPGQTLQPTALVHEAYLRIAGDAPARWENRAHFYRAAARAIRRVLIDRARAKRRLKRGGGARALSIELADVAGDGDPHPHLLALDEALERLGRLDSKMARVVELRFYGGLTEKETALALGLSTSTVTRAWNFARIWLHRELSTDGAPLPRACRAS